MSLMQTYYTYRGSNNHYWIDATVGGGPIRAPGQIHDQIHHSYVVERPSSKRRKFSASFWEGCDSNSYPNYAHETSSTSIVCCNESGRSSNTPASYKHGCSNSDGNNEAEGFISRDDIERCSPSRRDGIDALHEMHLRHSYCAFLQNLGLRLELPQTTTGTSMVLCHRFFLWRSHACHDRFVIATAALFLAAKYEETPRPLHDVLKASSEILYNQDSSFIMFLLPVGWLEQFRERVLEAETLLLTTLNFELNVQHPYGPLTATLNKFGLSQTVLVNLALKLISEGLRSSLWLQFKPHHIAAGAAYLASKLLNMDIISHAHIWQEFGTTPVVLQDVAQQLMELMGSYK